jgi:hypothetical protein
MPVKGWHCGVISRIVTDNMRANLVDWWILDRLID